MQQLEEKGLITHTKKPVGEKERKIFDLTDEGRKLCTILFKHFAELVSKAITSSLDVCAHCVCKIYFGAYREVIDDKEMTSCRIHCARSYNKVKELAKQAKQ